ncbi:ABC transporter substrate-binding protein [Desertibacillus haloalkaliphilus]|uniref:ABC transporter substrate-binding protein n=1 Tax=Desertibacillus haloalkaliphilus TaxID=1328930 RepID=UPI001C25E11F|nr:iron-siderophore ABC transporter substrate-binding protein [Desertibacillus haloalkaliphilus]MBU8908916.1 iron-siderophore ABC transporter substrate-binding protein [Desertibacillus haloalkaliphilus]
MRRASLKFILFSMMITLVLALAACGNNSEEETTEPAENDNEETTSSYIVEHAMGSTEIAGTPEKVVILTNEGTEALLALGVTPVGAVTSWTGDPWYEHISEDMEGVQELGTESEPNLEAIAALQPDLIIGNKMRQEAVYEQLSAIAPTVFAESLRGNWKINFELYAEALNKTEEGEQVLEDYAARIAAFQEEAGDLLDLEISMVRFLGGDVRIYQKDSFSGVILEEIGFNRPESQRADELAIMGATKEMIPDMDGDILFYFTYETGDGEGSNVEEEWLNDPLFQQLPVVERGDAHKVSDAIWNTAGGVLAAHLMIDDLESKILE